MFGGYFSLEKENFFKFWIVLGGKTSHQRNAEEQNGILIFPLDSAAKEDKTG